MPAGVKWSTYTKFTALALLSMVAGAQFVHVFYDPLRDLPQLKEKERQRLLKEMAANSPHQDEK